MNEDTFKIEKQWKKYTQKQCERFLTFAYVLVMPTSLVLFTKVEKS